MSENQNLHELDFVCATQVFFAIFLAAMGVSQAQMSFPGRYSDKGCFGPVLRWNPDAVKLN